MVFQILFAIKAYYNLDISQIDMKIIFLYGLIDQLIYVEILKETEIETNKYMICKLFKVLYDLK